MYRFLKNTLRSTNNIIEIIVYFFGISIVAVIVTALTLSAVTRYISGNGYDWFIELPPILISWLVFPLLGPILKNGQHIQVDFLTAVLARRSILTLKLLNNFVVFIGAILFFKAGIDATILYYQMGQMLEIELAIPMWWMYLAFPTGFLILIIFAFELIITDIERLVSQRWEIN
tara:strand:+ start:7160 stop:7681 length:522 start_codon:yes stop_codon:yes gene_type:complete